MKAFKESVADYRDSYELARENFDAQVRLFRKTPNAKNFRELSLLAEELQRAFNTLEVRKAIERSSKKDLYEG